MYGGSVPGGSFQTDFRLLAQSDNNSTEIMKKNRFSKHPFASLLMTFFFLSFLIETILRIANPDILEFAYNFRQVYKYHDNWYTDFDPDTSSLIRLKDSSGSYFKFYNNC